VGVRDRTDADGLAVSGVRAGGDPGRGTWRGAELKAPRGADGLEKARPRVARGADGLEKARPRVARGADVEATRQAGAWAMRGAARLAGGAWRRPARKRVSALLFERLKLQNLNRSAQSGQ
jgi:hypothetical protein